MNNFESVDFMVVPIQDPVRFSKRPNYGGNLICWSDESSWVSWQEREDFYPNCSDWFVIPPRKRTYERGGVEIAYFIIDLDNHEGDKFKEAYNLIWSLEKKGELPPTLTVKSASGGRHFYYWTFADAIPSAVDARRINGLPIEIKSSHGWVAPNGRDRVITRDLPIAPLHVTEGTWFGDFAKIKNNTRPSQPRSSVDPDFDIDSWPLEDAAPGYRHLTLNNNMIKLYFKGCPDDKAIEWGYKFFEANNRRPQRNEVENMWRDVKAWCGENNIGDMNDLGLIESELEPKSIDDIFPGMEELQGKEAIEAKAVFSTEEEKIELRKQWLELSKGGQ